MRLNIFAGTVVVPTLARLILAMAFLTVGYHKLFDTVEFSAEQAATLSELGIELVPVNAASVALVTPRPQQQPDPADPIDEKPPVQADQAEEQQPAPPSRTDAPAGQASEPPNDEVADNQAPVEQDADDGGQGEEGEGEIITIPPSSTEAVYRGLAVNQLVLLLNSNEIPRPRLMAWIAALTEFAGGLLILVGLFSRVWGLGLAITMAMAFYLTTMDPYFSTGPFDVARTAGSEKLYNTVFSQLGLGMLALTVFMVGPGPLSLDRLIFRPRRHGDAAFDNVEPRHARRSDG